MLHPQKNVAIFLWNPAGKNYGFGGGFLWVWIMGDEISEHSSACHKTSCKILWVPIMPGTEMLRVRSPFIFLF
jgi:hypothetical protein